MSEASGVNVAEGNGSNSSLAFPEKKIDLQ